jgi:hypothetical protein
MSVYLSLPAHINILGNPSDANEGNFATISAAIEIRSYATINSHMDYILEISGSVFLFVKFSPADLPLPYDKKAILVKAAINRLYAYSREFNEKLTTCGFCLRN